MWNPLIVATLLAAAPPQHVQEPPENLPPLLRLDELEVVRFVPAHADPWELYELAGQLIGRRYYIRERGGYQGDPVSNISQLGQGLVLYDTREYGERMLETLMELDRPLANARPSGPSEGGLETWEFSPRYLSLESVQAALEPFQRLVVDEGDQVANLSVSRLRRLLVFRDRAARLNEIRELLGRIDVPHEQVRVTCWLLQGGVPGAGEASLPSGLAEHLARLVPGVEFRTIGFAMLQTTVSGERPVSMQLDASREQRYELVFTPTAYDPATGSLTASRCELKLVPAGGQAATATLFSTDAILRGDELTVIGASGSKPVLVAVRLAPVGRP